MTARRGRMIVHQSPRKLAARGRTRLGGGEPPTAAELRYLMETVQTAASAVTVVREGATRLLGPGSPVGHAALDALLALGEARQDLEELVKEAERSGA